MVGLPAAYIAGGRRAEVDERVYLERISELEQRLERLERLQSEASTARAREAREQREPRRLRAVGTTVALDKDRAAAHYEVLASQLACERQITELEDRLAAVERTGHRPRPVPVWLASANGVPAGSRRRG